MLQGIAECDSTLIQPVLSYLNLLFVVSLLAFLSFGSIADAADQATVHHAIHAVLSPSRHFISVRDTITVPPGFPREFSFRLHKGLTPRMEGPGVLRREKGGHPLARDYRVSLPPGSKGFTVQYRGVIDHPVKTVGKEQARGFGTTAGIISEDGVYLGGESYWYPVFGSYVSFSLRVDAPGGWDAVSQGGRTAHDRRADKSTVRWESPEPQEEIYLVAGRFHEYAKPGGVALMAFIQRPDPALAGRYLDAAERYIAMYSGLIGQYPYQKFALVENFWETGFGMPSFTLLGPTVIRLPFIINSSYPHEVLHNWWGNGVYPDAGGGNWTEGLTAYLSDHLMKEQQGEGAEYRQATLQKYADYVSEGRDFPLTEFRSRHSTSSEAIGYGKSLMFFHMLRREMGDAAFLGGLREFYAGHRFSRASFNDLKTSLAAAAEKGLDNEFSQWVKRTGSPVIRVKDVAAAADGAGYMLSFSVRQEQEGEVYRLHVPVAVTMADRKQAEQFTLTISERDTKILLHLPARPVRVDVDPEFDVFRRLDPEETPPAVSGTLGARKVLVILPSAAPNKLRDAFRRLADAIASSGPEAADIKDDTDVSDLPADRGVVILGWENRFAYSLWPLFSGYSVTFHDPDLMIEEGRFSRERHAVVLTARQPVQPGGPVLFVGAEDPAAVPALGRKLPHYHKYSYLLFEGEGATNIAKGRWPVLHSPLTLFVPADDGSVPKVEMATLAPRQPLVALPQTFSKERMAETVRFLSSEALEGRGLGTAGLDKAADSIATWFRDAGLAPAGDADGYLQTWEEEVKGSGRLTLKNVVGVIRGKDASLSGRCVVVGAHYDHLGRGWTGGGLTENRGKIHPGADDNASGVAVLVELARHFSANPPADRSIVFAAFTGEDTGRLGSRHFVSAGGPLPVRDCIAMVNLDTVGRLAGKKLLAIGAESAAEWAHILRGAGYAAGVEVEAISQPLDSSDQVSFIEAGVPGLQLFSGPHPDYHRPSDTQGKIDADGLVKVATTAKGVIEYLASRREPLTASGSSPAEKHEGSGRSVGIGTVPDFGYQGKGFRISGTVPGSPAEAAGMREGDVIISLDGKRIDGIKDFSAILKTLQPGSRAAVVFLREGIETTREVEVKSR